MRRRHRYLGAFLSALIPGLGQLLQRRWRLAVVFLFPVVSILLSVLLLLVIDRTGALMRLVDPSILRLAIGAQAALLVWRLLAAGSALLFRAGRPLRKLDAVVAIALVALIAVPQAWLGYNTVLLHEAAERIFIAGTGSPSGTGWTDPPTPPPATALPGETGEVDPFPNSSAVVTPAPGPPSPSPSPPPPAAPRYNVLILGMDARPGRRHNLADVIVVASVRLDGTRPALVSVPRDLADVRLRDGRLYRGKINSLLTYVQQHPEEFRGQTGVDVLRGAVEMFLAIRLDAYAMVNFAGFVGVVDALGGVDVVVEKRLDQYGHVLEPGPQHLSGEQALAYAADRMTEGEDLFTRNARQQRLLVALRDRVVRGGFLRDIPAFLDAVADAVQTNVDPSQLPRLAALAERAAATPVEQVVIRPPLVRYFFDDDRGGYLLADHSAVHDLVRGVLG